MNPTTNNAQRTTRLLIGLGNPGKRYANNRHNAGFMAVDAIADDYGFSPWSKKFQGLICEGIIPPPPVGGRLGGGLKRERKVILLKPQTYMNLSGESALAAAQFYKIDAANITVIHDELDLPLCKIRVKRGGGNSGHNGLKSLDEHLGKDYQRLRFGIGHPGDKDLVSDYVLADFGKAERKEVDALIAEISDHIGLLLQGDEAGFMNKLTVAAKE